MYKILNLYACLGGNRKNWTDCSVTAVEINPEIAELYKRRFPEDTVIVGDAHQYLLDHYHEYDFVWSSPPPCPSHSRIQTSLKNRETFVPCYPDMKLYEEIIFLSQFFKGKYCVENVRPYYPPLIPGYVRGRHIYWTNFPLPTQLSTRVERIGGKNEHARLEKFHDITMKANIGGYRDILRNLVDYEVGARILQVAREISFKSEKIHPTLFQL